LIVAGSALTADILRGKRTTDTWINQETTLGPALPVPTEEALELGSANALYCAAVLFLLLAIIIIDDLVKSPFSQVATEITKRILNVFNMPFFVPLWLCVKMSVLTTASLLVVDR